MENCPVKEWTFFPGRAVTVPENYVPSPSVDLVAPCCSEVQSHKLQRPLVASSQSQCKAPGAGDNRLRRQCSVSCDGF